MSSVRPKIIEFFGSRGLLLLGLTIRNQAEKEGTVEPLVPWTVVGRPVDGRRTAGGRSSAARVSSAAPKKKSFDRGGPVWPPRSNVTNDRLRGGVWGGFAPQAKNWGVWGAAPYSQKPIFFLFSKIRKKIEKKSKRVRKKNISPLIFRVFNRKSRC